MPTVRYGEVVHTNDVPSSLEDRLKIKRDLQESPEAEPGQEQQTNPKLNQKPKRSE